MTIIGDTYRVSGLQRLLVHLENTQEVCTQIGEDEEVARGVEDGLVRAGLVLRFGEAVGRDGVNPGLDDRNRGGIGNVESVNAASGATESGVLAIVLYLVW